jgi:EAL domain-containing protein (putative c-di-GMP-specific phosphodiesterase class I)
MNMDESEVGEVSAAELRAQIRDRLVRDLKDDRFVLYFQSIVPLAPAQKEGQLFREILVRFKDEERDMLPPGTFLPTLEEQGLMPVLDRWVVLKVLAWIRAKHLAMAPRPAPVCGVNLSSDTICRDRTFAEFVLKAAAQTQSRPASVLFEIPALEGVPDVRAIARVVLPLRSAGFSFAISGFTGDESGFEVAKSLGVSHIKIDGSLAARVATDAKAKAKVLVIQKRCQELGMRTVGMQVENPETLEALRGIKVDFAQGFGIDRPRVLA